MLGLPHARAPLAPCLCSVCRSRPLHEVVMAWGTPKRYDLLKGTNKYMAHPWPHATVTAFIVYISVYRSRVRAWCLWLALTEEHWKQFKPHDLIYESGWHAPKTSAWPPLSTMTLAHKDAKDGQHPRSTQENYYYTTLPNAITTLALPCWALHVSCSLGHLCVQRRAGRHYSLAIKVLKSREIILNHMNVFRKILKLVFAWCSLQAYNNVCNIINFQYVRMQFSCTWGRYPFSI